MASPFLALPPLFLLLLSSRKAAAQSAAPAPEAAGPINLPAILEKGGQFITFIHLLNTTQIDKQVNGQINGSTEGMTVFAPTDSAFQNLKPGTLNQLTTQQQVQLLLYHIAPKYYSLNDFLSVSNPVRTQATQGDGLFGLNFTGQGNQVNVSTGVVETQLNNALRQRFPLAVYVVDKVLLPEELFGQHKLTPPPPPPKPVSSDAANSTNSTKKSPAPTGNSGTGGRKGGLGSVLGVVLLSIKLFLL